MKDLIGEKFGLLTVIKHAGKPSKRHRWICRCDCGTEKNIQGNHLTYGKIKSCGCLKKRSGKDSPFFRGHGEIPLDVFSVIRRGAAGGGKFNRRPKEFLITIKYIWELFLKQNRKCALTNLDIGFEGRAISRKKKSTSKITASLDRIDSSKGYIEGNVQWIHKDINIMKNDYDVNHFIAMCKLVSKNNA